MRDHKFIMTVPLAKRHSVTIISNQEMTIEAWRTLNRYLALQREICTDEEVGDEEKSS